MTNAIPARDGRFEVVIVVVREYRRAVRLEQAFEHALGDLYTTVQPPVGKQCFPGPHRPTRYHRVSATSSRAEDSRSRDWRSWSVAKIVATSAHCFPGATRSTRPKRWMR